MSNKLKKVTALAAAMTMVVSCGNVAWAAEGEAPWLKDGKIEYPIQSEETLKIWCWTDYVGDQFKDYTEAPFTKYMEEELGVKLEWEFATGGFDQQSQAYSLLLAEGTEGLPDIVISQTRNDAVTGIENGYYIGLDEYMEYAPAFSSYLAANPDVEKASKLDDGTVFYFPFVRGDDRLCVYQGPGVRKDWLDELGLSVPETVEEYDAVARAFYEKKGATVGVVEGQANMLMASAFDAKRDYYQTDNVVKYGPIEDGYREFLTFMNKWYEDGILDPDFATLDGATLKTKALNDQSGLVTTTSGTMSSYIAESEAAGTPQDWVGIPYPVKNKGDKVQFSQYDAKAASTHGARITTNCKNIPLAMAVLDYAFTEEGILYWNFGKEGVSYEMVDGYPTFTELSKNNPLGITYGANVGQGVGPQDWRMFEQRNNPAAVEAVNTWTNEDTAKHILAGMTFTTEEQDLLATKNTQITTMVNEMYFKFIMGEEELTDENWDAYVTELKNIGLDETIAVYQAAWDRVCAR